MTAALSPPSADLTAAVASLLGHGADHTVAEIAQQPALWRQVGRDVERWADRDTLAAVLARPGLRIVLSGAGTSAFAGEVLAPVLARQGGRRVDAVATTTMLADPCGVFAEDVPTLLVSFARSGDSPESTAATAIADSSLTECHHLVLTCNPDGGLARSRSGRDRSHVLLMPAGSHDRGFAMTSSFSCMLLAARLVLGATDFGPAATADRVAVCVEREFAARVAATGELAARGHGRVVYLGSGSLQGLARESALKLLELTAGRVVAISDSPLGFRHGPKAFLDDDTLALVYLSADPYTRRYDLDIVRELRSTLPAGQVVAVGADPADGLDGPGWTLPELDGLDDALRALPAVVGAQLLALQASLARGLGSDNPFPAGEVNRVVQGVTVHPFDGAPVR